MSDEKLESLVNEYADLAKNDKIDTAALLMNALEQEDQNRLSSKTKRWAYLISLGIPPLGLLFAVYFYFSDKSDGKNAAIVCVILTAISGIFTIILFKSFMTGAGVSTEQIQQIKPQDIYELSR